MKLTDLKREHFINGQTFSQKMLDAYIAARMNARRDYLMRYPVCLLGGVAVGLALSLLVPLGGILKMLLPMLCVMGGALIGAKITTASMEELRTQAQKICLTRKDIRLAKRNLKNGTVAWSETSMKPSA